MRYYLQLFLELQEPMFQDGQGSLEGLIPSIMCLF